VPAYPVPAMGDGKGRTSVTFVGSLVAWLAAAAAALARDPAACAGRAFFVRDLVMPAGTVPTPPPRHTLVFVRLAPRMPCAATSLRATLF
jgi:hypothetical protein